MKETLAQKKIRGRSILKYLREDFPEPACALHHEGPYQLLIATILSAQCTDARVNMVTPELFQKAPSPEAMVKLGIPRIKKLIRSINFFNNKARNIWLCSKTLIESHASQVPQTMEALVDLPGVGRKTANVVLGNAFSVPGIVVDTHVRRLSQRLTFTREEDPVKIEKDLEKIFEVSDWVDLSHLLILHGRKTCRARNPLCRQCSIATFCPSRQDHHDSLSR